ncbi:MAG: hypothetical protein LDL31_10225, partial [Prosthecobacter sp.]|nr:hypothetical protein [Prosthecobacter sp.]
MSPAVGGACPLVKPVEGMQLDRRARSGEHGTMQARVFQFQVGRTKLGWFGKTILVVIAAVLIALLLTFGLVAAVVGVIALLAAKGVRALGGGQRAN